MSGEVSKSCKARLLSEMEEFFPECKHSERELHLIIEIDKLNSKIAELELEINNLKLNKESKYGKF